MLEQANLEAIETGEWLESLDWVLEHAGPERARQLLAELQAHARHCGVALPSVASTPYVNTIVFYSIFGFQRVGDLIWAAGDQGGRGFLIGATSGRTTLNGEGLQHQDGHSHLIAFTCPHVVAYDTAYACGWCQR